MNILSEEFHLKKKIFRRRRREALEDLFGARRRGRRPAAPEGDSALPFLCKLADNTGTSWTDGLLRLPTNKVSISLSNQLGKDNSSTKST